MAKSPTQIVPLDPPMNGIDEDSSFTGQRKGTSPNILNMRPFDCVTTQRRLSRRAGFAKFSPDQLAAASIQDIVAVSTGLPETTGDFFSFGSASTTFTIFDDTQADSTPDTHPGPTADTLTGAAAHSMGTTDEDNNFYVAYRTTRTVTIKKLNTDYASSATILQWTATLVLTAGGSPGDCAIIGLGAIGGVLYLMVGNAAASAIASPGIYRFKTADGSLLEAGPWKPAVGTVGTLGTYTMPATVLAAQCLCVGTSVLSTVGQVGSNLVCQQWNKDTGALLYQNTLEAFNTSPAKIIVDRGNNVYVLSNATSGGTDQKLYRITSAGVLATSPYPIAIAGAMDIAYDAINFQIGVVGALASSKSFVAYTADTGVNSIVAWAPGTLQNFQCVTFDSRQFITVAGVTTAQTGRWIMRSDQASGADLVRITGLQPSGASITSDLTTSLGSHTLRQWIICAGNIVAPAPTYMQSTRTTRILAVCNGNLYRLDKRSYGWEKTLVKTSFLSSTAPVTFSAIMDGVIHYVDGLVYGTYDIASNVAGTLTASAGSLPADPNGLKCRLRERWRDRLIGAGLLTDPQNVFASQQGDATNYDYSPVSPSPIDAWALNLADAGNIPDTVTAFITLGDNFALVGGDHTIHRISGDPADFGKVDAISDAIGIAWGRAFCRDEQGTVYFLSTKGPIYRMGTGGQPQGISTPIDNRLRAIDYSQHLVRMAWDAYWGGFHVLISPLDSTEAARHYWWDERTARTNTYQVVASPGSWWPDQFTNANHNALALCVMDGDESADRFVLFGGRDGYIRFLENEAISDDGTAISSEVWWGPIQDGVGNFMRITDLRMTMSSGSESLNYTLHSAESAESAFGATGRFAGEFSGGRNHSQSVRAGGHAHFIRTFTAEKEPVWSVEAFRAVVTVVGGLVPSRTF